MQLAVAAVGDGGFAFDEHHEKKETKEVDQVQVVSFFSILLKYYF
jgi:hypothetical protein